MTASEVLIVLLRVNLAAGAAILAATALRKPVRRRMGARLAYGLWLLPGLAAAAALLPARQVRLTLPAAPAAGESGFVTAFEAVAGVHRSGAFDFNLFLLAGWLAGVGVCALAMIHMQRRFTTSAALGEAGPAVVGVVAPRIITPAAFGDTFSAEEQALVLAHEQAHIARHDSRINAVCVAAQCLFWFNPLVHLAAHLARIDQEMACDETVLTRFPAARGLYARALVKAQLANRPLPLGCYWPSGTEHPLEERLAMLKAKPLRPIHRIAGSAALALTCAAAGAAGWAAQPPRLIVTTLAAAPAPAPQQATAPAPAPVAEAPPAAPAQVCISNSCSARTAPAATTSLADAIAKGDTRAVVAMGGSGRDALAALRAGPNAQRYAALLDRMDGMDNIVVANMNGRAALVGTDGDNHKMVAVVPDLGDPPASAPVETPPQIDPQNATTVTSPDGTVRTIIQQRVVAP